MKKKIKRNLGPNNLGPNFISLTSTGCKLLWSQDLRVSQEKEPCIGFTQENLIENSV